MTTTRQQRRAAERARDKAVKRAHAGQAPSAPWEQMEEVAEIRKGDGTVAPTPENERWFGNATYSACLRRYEPDEEGNGVPLLHISYHRRDRAPARDWRETQALKNDLVGESQEMVELYPDQARVVDTANEYHLWGLEGTPLPVFGFPEGLSEADIPDEYIDTPGAKQRPRAED